MTKRNALISVSDKENIVEFAKRLIALDFNVIASGGTAKLLESSGVRVTSTAEVINIYARDILKKNNIKITPEIEHSLGGAILDHRVVTLSREIHGGILARKDHMEELSKLMIPWIDLVCVDFYPFEKTIAKPGITMYEAIEQDDVGGPTMIHSAAKGAQEGRIVISDPKDRDIVLALLEQSSDHDLTQEKKNELASKADYIVSRYCMMVSTYRSDRNFVGMFGEKVAACKYGENAHQTPAALYSNGSNDPLALDQFVVVEGMLPSYNNYCDIYRMTQIATHIAGAFDKNTKKVPFMAIGVKHGNPCGTAIGTNPKQVLKKMMSGDPLSIFGGLVMTNFPIDEKLVSELSGRMLDGIIAPAFSNDAIEKLKRKGNKCRFVVNKELSKLSIKSIDTAPYFRYVRGGFLEQPNYTFVIDLKAPEIKQYGKISQSQKNDLLLAWAIGSTSNSNTISIVKNGQLIGNGVGQQDRVGAAKLALERAKRSKHTLAGASAFSDSFFPFPDAPEVLIKAGIKTILSTSGSVKDDLTITLCQKKGTGLIMIPDSLGRGFFGH
ncbi:MAG: hypothetical protein V4469_01025 [Patescibacteria group bacterium]